MVETKEQVSPVQRARATGGQRFLLAVGVVLLVVWGAWWGVALSMEVPRLPDNQNTSMSVFPFIGLDFVHNYVGGRTWVTGGNPYEKIVGDPLFNTYGYAPAVLPFFAWCYFFDPNISANLIPPQPREGSTGFLNLSTAAVRIWVLATAAFCIFGAWQVWRFRRERGELTPVPLLFVIGMTLMSVPAVLEMERGNCNVLALMLVLVSVVMMRRRPSWLNDIVVAVLLAFAIWVKAYAVFALLAVVAVRRYRVAALSVLATGLIAAVWWNQTMIFATKLRGSVASFAPDIDVLAHPIVATWPKLMAGTPLAEMPPLAGGLMVIGVPALVVSYLLWRLPRREEFLLPLTLWCVAAGTYFPHVAYDYNYLSFVLVALALWDQRNAFWVHGIMGLLLLWWQPFLLPFSPVAVFWVKVLALYAMGYCLVMYARALPVKMQREW